MKNIIKSDMTKSKEAAPVDSEVPQKHLLFEDFCKAVREAYKDLNGLNVDMRASSLKRSFLIFNITIATSDKSKSILQEDSFISREMYESLQAMGYSDENLLNPQEMSVEEVIWLIEQMPKLGIAKMESLFILLQMYVIRRPQLNEALKLHAEFLTATPHDIN